MNFRKFFLFFEKSFCGLELNAQDFTGIFYGLKRLFRSFFSILVLELSTIGYSEILSQNGFFNFKYRMKAIFCLTSRRSK